MNETDSAGASVLLVATVRGHADLVTFLLDVLFSNSNGSGQKVAMLYVI